MTADELVRSLFGPVAAYMEQHLQALPADQLRELNPPSKPQHGNEPWFGQRIRNVLPDLVRSIEPRGPDLILRDGTEIELKAANDCRPPYMAGTEKPAGWRKYLDRQNFAGCLFMADGSDQLKIEEIKRVSKPAVQLRAHRIFRDAIGNQWVVGLLLKREWP